MKDDIVGFAKAVNLGVKLWMVTKIVAVYSTIKKKADKVTGFFSDMKDDIVEFAEDIHKGIKLWLIKELGAISGKIRRKVDAVNRVLQHYEGRHCRGWESCLRRDQAMAKR